jgi:hypothetical protein
MTEAEQQELFTLVTAAFDAKGTPEFADRVRAIEDRWMPAYEFWLVRHRDLRRGQRKQT